MNLPALLTAAQAVIADEHGDARQRAHADALRAALALPPDEEVRNNVDAMHAAHWGRVAASRYDQLEAACRGLGVEVPPLTDASVPLPPMANPRADAAEASVERLTRERDEARRFAVTYNEALIAERDDLKAKLARRVDMHDVDRRALIRTTAALHEAESRLAALVKAVTAYVATFTPAALDPSGGFTSDGIVRSTAAFKAMTACLADLSAAARNHDEEVAEKARAEVMQREPGGSVVIAGERFFPQAQFLTGMQKHAASLTERHEAAIARAREEGAASARPLVLEEAAKVCDAEAEAMLAQGKADAAYIGNIYRPVTDFDREINARGEATIEQSKAVSDVASRLRALIVSPAKAVEPTLDSLCDALMATKDGSPEEDAAHQALNDFASRLHLTEHEVERACDAASERKAARPAKAVETDATEQRAWATAIMCAATIARNGGHTRLVANRIEELADFEGYAAARARLEHDGVNVEEFLCRLREKRVSAVEETAKVEADDGLRIAEAVRDACDESALSFIRSKCGKDAAHLFEQSELVDVAQVIARVRGER